MFTFVRETEEITHQCKMHECKIKQCSFFLKIKAGLGVVRNERAYSVESSLQRLFIELFVVETNQIASSNSNVILTRQTCGQRSRKAARGKRRALAFYFSVLICCMFQYRLGTYRNIEDSPILVFA